MSPTGFGELKFIEITESEANEIRSTGGRGRKAQSLPLLKAFEDSGLKQAKLARECLPPGVPAARLGAGLKAFARNHRMLVDVVVRGGELYMFRLDKPLLEGEK